MTLVTASDNIDPNPTITCDPSPAVFYSYIAPDDTDTLVTCIATDASGNVSLPGTFTVTVTDNTPPILTLTPDEPEPSIRLRQQLDVNNNCVAFDEPGFTAIDIVDGDVTNSVVFDLSEVNMCVAAGSVDNTLTYTVQDASGNAATPVDRPVNVIDYFFEGIGALTVPIGGTATVTVLNFDYDVPNVSPQVTLTSKLIGGELIVDVEPQGGGVFTSTEVLFSSVVDPSIQTHVVKGGDTVNIKYLSFEELLEEKQLRIGSDGNINAAFGGGAGTQSDPSDPIRFFESDIYYYNQAAQIVVNDPNVTEDTVLVSVAVGDTGFKKTFYEFTATRLGETSEFFTNPYITFSPVTPDESTPFVLDMNPDIYGPLGTITATYTGTIVIGPSDTGSGGSGSGSGGTGSNDCDDPYTIGSEPDMKKDSSIGDCTVIGDKFKAEKNLVIGTSGMIGDEVQIKKDVTIGDNVKIGFKADIEEYVTIGNNVKIGDNVKIEKNVTIGDNVEIPDDTTVKSDIDAVIRFSS
jgi:hypothetical protein